MVDYIQFPSIEIVKIFHLLFVQDKHYDFELTEVKETKKYVKMKSL